MEGPEWDMAEKQVEPACSNWQTPFPKPMPPSLVREGREAKTQIKQFSSMGTSFCQIWIFHLSYLYSLVDVDKTGIFGAEVDVKLVLTPKRVSWAEALSLPSCNFHL